MLWRIKQGILELTDLTGNIIGINQNIKCGHVNALSEVFSQLREKPECLYQTIFERIHLWKNNGKIHHRQKRIKIRMNVVKWLKEITSK